MKIIFGSLAAIFFFSGLFLLLYVGKLASGEMYMAMVFSPEARLIYQGGVGISIAFFVLGIAFGILYIFSLRRNSLPIIRNVAPR